MGWTKSWVTSFHPWYASCCPHQKHTALCGTNQVGTATTRGRHGLLRFEGPL